MDIASALEKLSHAIFNFSLYKKAQIIEPYTITCATSAKCIAQNLGGGQIKCFYVGVEVRSMGTATYVRLGGINSMNSSLSGVGAYQEFEAPKNSYLDMSKLFIISDTSDAVVEVSGTYIPRDDDQ